MTETIKESHTRFSSVPWYGNTRELTIGGLGTIGSWLSLLIARTGDHEILLYDNDTIEKVNYSGQFFSKDQLEKTKVGSAAENLLNFTEINDFNVHTFNSKFDENTYVSNVTFSCFDNMEARKAMFDAWCKNEERELFIDGRMSIESYEVFTVKRGQEERYRKTLFDDSEVGEQICSLKNTSHTGALIAARMVTAFTNYLANESMELAIRDTSFYFREDMEMQLINMKK